MHYPLQKEALVCHPQEVHKACCDTSGHCLLQEVADASPAASQPAARQQAVPEACCTTGVLCLLQDAAGAGPSNANQQAGAAPQFEGPGAERQQRQPPPKGHLANMLGAMAALKEQEKCAGVLQLLWRNALGAMAALKEQDKCAAVLQRS